MGQQQPDIFSDPHAGTPLRGDVRRVMEAQAEDDPIFSDPTAGEPLRVNASKTQRFGENFMRNILPSTTLRDYVEGPLYAARHPIDSAGLLINAIAGAHADQASKTGEAAGRVISEPTLGGKLGAASETLGHGLATVLPLAGPAAANAGEQIASGDIAGGLGAAAGLLTPSAVTATRGITAPLKARVAESLHADAVTRVGKALAPTTKENKVRTERIAPEILRRRVTARNLGKLEDVASLKSAEAGARVDAALQPHASKTADTMALVDDLENAKAEYVGTATDGTRVVNDPQRVRAIEKLQDVLMNYGDEISVESMTKLRRNWDQVVEAGKGFTTPKAGVKAWAAREGRSVLRDELVKTVPDLDKINKEYAFWQSLEDITNATNQRRQGQKGDLTSTIAGAGGAVAAEIMAPGAGVVKGGLQAALGAKVFASLKRLMDSPGWQLWTAVQKERLADALMAKDVPRVLGLIHSGMIAVTQTSRAAGRLHSGRPVPQAAENAIDREDLSQSSRRGSRQ